MAYGWYNRLSMYSTTGAYYFRQMRWYDKTQHSTLIYIFMVVVCVYMQNGKIVL